MFLLLPLSLEFSLPFDAYHLRGLLFDKGRFWRLENIDRKAGRHAQVIERAGSTIDHVAIGSIVPSEEQSQQILTICLRSRRDTYN